MSRRAGQDGAAAVLTLVLVALLTVVALVGGAVTASVAVHRRVQAAADLAALAGAAAEVRGEDGCAAAAEVAGWNGARAASCSVDAGILLVETRAPLPFGHGRSVSARARAGPVR